jgi:3-oxoadipate enol-lactonase
MDSAVMLVTSGALRMILADLERASDRVAQLADAHAATPMAARTLLQHARPTTFGAKAAAWLAGLDEAIDNLVRVREERIALQLGGPAGTLEGMGPDAQGLVEAVAARLGLRAPAQPWHAQRGRVADLAGALGTAAAAMEKVAGDLVLLAQEEVGEARDADRGRGGSSSMGHKRNPIAAILARAAGLRAPGYVATLLAVAGSGEHERAAGAWHAEWPALRGLLVAVGSAAAWLRDALDGLEIDTARMAENLARTGHLDDRDEAVDAARTLAGRSLAAHRVRGASPASRAARLHHVVEGPEGAAVVVLGNSLGSTLAMWDAVAGMLARRFRVVRYDLRGHGESPTPPGPYAIDDLGTDLVRLLDDLGLERVHLVGTSIGGMAALWVAANAPRRVDRLVAVGTSARLGPAQGWIDRAANVLGAGTAAVADTVLPRWVTPGFASSRPEEMARYRAMFDAADPAGYAGCCLAIAGMDLVDSLVRIIAPTLVVVGSDDPATPPEHAELLAARIPGARMATIEGAAHLPSIERPDELVRLVLDHIS